jgi:hypothetical protein
MKKLLRGLALLMSLAVGGCYHVIDSVQEYTQRADAGTLSAGDAQEVNSRIQMIDPWPKYVGDTRIAANGERMAGAAERYRDVSKLRQAPQPLPLVSTGGSASAGGSSGGASTAAGQ